MGTCECGNNSFCLSHHETAQQFEQFFLLETNILFELQFFDLKTSQYDGNLEHIDQIRKKMQQKLIGY